MVYNILLVWNNNSLTINLYPIFKDLELKIALGAPCSKQNRSSFR